MKFRYLPVLLVAFQARGVNFCGDRSRVFVTKSQASEVNPITADTQFSGAVSAILSVPVAHYLVVSFFPVFKVVGGLSNDSIAVDLKPKLPEVDGAEPSAKGGAAAPMSDEAISEFLNQVSSLIRSVPLCLLRDLFVIPWKFCLWTDRFMPDR